MNMYRRVVVALHTLTSTLDEREGSCSSPSGHFMPRSRTHDTHAWAQWVPDLVFVKGEEKNLAPCYKSKAVFSGNTDYHTCSNQFFKFIFIVLITAMSVAQTIEH
jgi:hypothetical protein